MAFVQGYQVYTPEEVQVILANEYPMQDWNTINVDRDEDNASITKSTKGRARVLEKADSVYMVELVLPDMSVDKAFLQYLKELRAYFNITIKDLRSQGDLFVGKNCYILKEGNFEKSTGESEITYMIGSCYGKLIQNGAALDIL